MAPAWIVGLQINHQRSIRLMGEAFAGPDCIAVQRIRDEIALVVIKRD